MRQPFAMSERLVVAARALVAHPRWRWPQSPATPAVNAAGAVHELRGGASPTGEGWLPYLPDPPWIAHLMILLGAACGRHVAYTVGCRNARYTCILEAGPHRRAWEGESLPEVLADALLARWAALDRAPPR